MVSATRTIPSCAHHPWPTGVGKLSPEQVAEMRRLHADGWGYTRLSRRFGVHRASVKGFRLIVVDDPSADLAQDATDCRGSLGVVSRRNRSAAETFTLT